MNWIFEESFWPILGCVFLAIVSGVFYFNGGGKIFGFAAAVFVGLAVAAFFVESMVETDREKLVATVMELADAVSDNDVDRAVTFLDPENDAVVSAVRNEMPGYDFSSCNVMTFKDIHIGESHPAVATVDFVVFASVDASRSAFKLKNVKARREVVLKFVQKPNGEWRVTDYRHFDPAQKKFIDARQPQSAF